MLFYLRVSVSPGRPRCAAARARAARPARGSAGRCAGGRARSASSGRRWTAAQLQEHGHEGGRGTEGNCCRAPPPPTRVLCGSKGFLTSELVLGKGSEHFKPLTCANAHLRPLSELYFHSRREIIFGFFQIIPSCNLHFHIHVTLRDCQQLCHFLGFTPPHIYPLPAHRAEGNVTVRDRQNYIFSSPVLQMNCS